MKKLVFFLLVCISFSVFAQIEPNVKELKQINPKHILMVGNSFMYYNDSMHKPLTNLIKSNKRLGKGHKLRSITINGSSLTWHDVDSYINNQNMGSFSITSSNEYKQRKREPFDIAIMQDCSQCPVNEARREKFHDVVDEHSKTLRKNKVEPVLMMTWAYKNVPSMIEGLAEEYLKAGNRNGILVIPVGLAFDEINRNYPSIDLYTSDKRHPSREGTYLAACVIFASIFKESPIGNAFLFGIERDIALNLQKVAWETSLGFYN